MDFEVTYTEEQQRFRREVRAWLEATVPATMLRTPTSAEDNYRRYLELRDFGRKLGESARLFRMLERAFWMHTRQLRLR